MLGKCFATGYILDSPLFACYILVLFLRQSLSFLRHALSSESLLVHPPILSRITGLGKLLGPHLLEHVFVKSTQPVRALSPTLRVFYIIIIFILCDICMYTCMCMCMSQHMCAGQRSICGSWVSSSNIEDRTPVSDLDASAFTKLICLARPVCLTTATEETNAKSRNPCPHPVFSPLPLRAACRVELGRVEAGLRVGGGAYPQNGRSEVSQTRPMNDGNYRDHNASRSRDCVVARTGGLGASAPRN